MIPVVALVEGYGDLQAVPALVARIGVKLDMLFLASNPIRAGEWKSLVRPGRLEKNLDLAESRKKNGRDISVNIVFFYREYETMFLQCPECLPSCDRSEVPEDPLLVRGAKERVKKLIGRRYRETQDQLAFTRSLDLRLAFENSRPFRKLCKILSGMSYEELQSFFV